MGLWPVYMYQVYATVTLFFIVGFFLGGEIWVGTQQQEVECRYKNHVFCADMCLGFFVYCYNLNMFVRFVAFFCYVITVEWLEFGNISEGKFEIKEIHPSIFLWLSGGCIAGAAV